MRHVLHLIKDPVNRVALDVVAKQARDPEVKVSVVLLGQAASLTAPVPGEAFSLDEGGGDGARSPYPRISHSQLLDLIFTADTVVTW